MRIEPFDARRAPTVIVYLPLTTPMSRPGFIPLALSALLLAAGCSQLDQRARTSESGGEQILIMLKDTQVRHYRPGTDFVSYGGPGRVATRRVAEALAGEHGLHVIDEWAMPVLGVRCFVAELPEGRAAQEVVERLNADARVEWAQVVHLFRAAG